MTTDTVENLTQPESTYTVVSGDTLWGIANHYYGSGHLWRNIYDSNAETIRLAAEENKFGERHAAQPGHWIFPGTVLVIPPLD
jgi:nucleoid-associated protein YgaU